jgi:tetratricopeptide (TPR) repeat protein
MAERADFLDPGRSTAPAENPAPKTFPLDRLGPAAGLPAELRAAAEPYDRGELEAARRSCESAYEFEPYNAAVLAGLGTVEFRQGDYTRAQMRYQKLASIDPAMAGQFAFLANPPRLHSDEQIKQSIQLIWLND